MPTFDFVLLSICFEIDGKECIEEFPVDSSTNGMYFQFLFVNNNVNINVYLN